MSAGASLWERDDLPALGVVPFPDCSRTSRSALEINTNRHGEAECPHGDIHSAVPNFIFRNFIQKYRQACRHDHWLHSVTLIPEQLKIGPDASALIQRLTLRFRNFVLPRPKLGLAA